ncbi:glycoside hydrolase family 127 protein (plasmid) [Halarchaeum sp. CBA1220]|uniref:glycoside hydrolase family 127 protein n=1 Tax=Halarchaeum sp. CBA1220 TaxID=1853682 RepID=UPI000F3A9215|nr:beta-L-arabinofuranosidase domain-containing protein [Halarchaeum sp. CBA1220]QLC35062.1 glycoside hydrolase family 127 protein [Halarchaeum sp. CBA1220]
MSEQRKPLSIGSVEIEDDFWRQRREVNREKTIEYQYQQLRESGTLENFHRASEGESGGHNGMWFQDSDAYKWIEAASYVLANHHDPELAERVEEVIELVAAAQEEDGYLNTYFALEEPENRWTNLNMMHELYCAGHLIEAAVAHHRATGETSLLDVATDFADHIDRTFEDDIDGAPGHQEIELALMELADVTDEERYRDLARYFVDIRGHNDRLAWEFANIEEIAGYDPDDDEGGIAGQAVNVFLEDGEYDGSYAQAHAPLREQETVEGHSVRAMYYFAGATDVAVETDDDDLLQHLDLLWRNMTEKRMYVTGGIGSQHVGERFTTDYDLPNDTAYAETCAAIGSIFWNQRLFEETGKSKYADLIERQLYNATLVGVSLDGTEFFYDNVLESDGSHDREGWFECACCPPNIARLIASLERYLYAVDDDGLYVNQYVSGTATPTIDGTTATVTQTTDFPWEGTVELDVETPEETEFAVRLRVPEWCTDVSVSVNGTSVAVDATEDYVTLERVWDDDRITAEFEMDVQVLEAHPKVEDDVGRVALQRGPLVYCVEGVDNDRPLHQYSIDSEAEFEVTYREDLLDGVATLDATATVPAKDGWDGELYRSADETDETTAPITAVPYYAWNNRGPNRMQVWIREA